MALVVSVFEPADYRGGGTDQFGELLLGEAGTLAKRINLPRNRIVSFGFREFGHALGTPLIMEPVNDLDCVARPLALLLNLHKQSLLVRMELGRLLVSSPSHQCRVDSGAGNSILFGQTVR